jgi:hypothetical protein
MEKYKQLIMDTNIFSEDYKPDEEGYITFSSEQGINEMAAYTFPGEDVSRFKEMTDLNPDIYTEDYFGTVEIDLKEKKKKPKKVKIPFESDLLLFANPVFNKKKVPFLQGYAEKAIKNIEDNQEGLYSPSLLSDTADMYDDQELPRLIPWLLSGKP